MAITDDFITNLTQLGFFEFLLPWLFTFAIVYGLLMKANLFDKVNAKVSGVLALVIAFFITPFAGPWLTNFFAVTGLGITAANDWDNNNPNTGEANIDADIALLDAAKVQIQNYINSFTFDTNVLNIHENFLTNLAETFQEGSDKFLLADLNEEASKLLALQTREQLILSSLSVTRESENIILSLFR